MSIRVTARDRRLLSKLAVARWLTTWQIAALCFPTVTIEMARRRVRLLRGARYIRSFQGNQMAEALHTLGPKGRGLLLTKGGQEAIPVVRRPPRNLEHFVGINHIRVAVERSALSEDVALGFFFTCWELQQNGWPYPVIPDAVCQVERSGKSTTILFEYDRGEENARYVTRTKFRPYAQGLAGFPFSQVLVVVDTERRFEELRKHAVETLKPGLFSFILMEAIKHSWNLTDWLSQNRCGSRCIGTTV
jgi:hypothetical protein